MQLTRSDLDRWVLSRLARAETVTAFEQCRALTARVMPGYDFTRELELTDRMSLGDTVLLGTPQAPTGFAVYHTAPLVEGRTREEMRVLKMVLERRSDLPPILGGLADLARRIGARRLAIRLQGDYQDALRVLI